MLVAITETQHLDEQDSPRRRGLAEWRLIYEPLKSGHNLYYLTGRVVSEGGELLQHIRITTTSPIVSREGSVVTTASGSKYWLQNPHDEQKLDPEQWGPQVYNPWIEGNNWVHAR